MGAVNSQPSEVVASTFRVQSFLPLLSSLKNRYRESVHFIHGRARAFVVSSSFIRLHINGMIVGENYTDSMPQEESENHHVEIANLVGFVIGPSDINLLFSCFLHKEGTTREPIFGFSYPSQNYITHPMTSASRMQWKWSGILLVLVVTTIHLHKSDCLVLMLNVNWTRLDLTN
ncbi:hypothetical protein Dimus_029647 [Dionaea muscipula]